MNMKIRNSVIMAGDVISTIKNVAKDMSEQVNINKKKEIHKKAEEILQKLQKQSENQASKKDSLFDFEFFKENKTNKINDINNQKDFKNNNDKYKNLQDLNEENSKDIINFSPFNKKEKSKFSKQGFYEKQLEYLSQHELKMNHMRKEKFDIEKKLMKTIPKINKNSNKIVMKKKNMIKSASMNDMKRKYNNQDELENRNDMEINSLELQPFYIRSQNIFKEQEERKEKLRQLYEMINRQKEERSNPNTIVVRVYDENENEKWRQEKLKWKEKREEKLLKLKKDINNKILTEVFPYSPELDKNSEKIINEKYNNSNFYMRNKYYEKNKGVKMQRIQNELIPQFSPNLNKDIPKYIRKQKIQDFKLKKSESTGRIMKKQSQIKNQNNENLSSQKVLDEETIFQKSNINVDKSNVKIKKNSYLDDKTDINYYNLNVRDNSVWNQNKENLVVLNSGKYFDLMNKYIIKDETIKCSNEINKEKISNIAWK